MRWLDNITNSRDMGLGKLWEVVEDRGAWRTAVHGVTQRLSSSALELQQPHSVPVLDATASPDPKTRKRCDLPGTGAESSCAFLVLALKQCMKWSCYDC